MRGLNQSISRQVLGKAAYANRAADEVCTVLFVNGGSVDIQTNGGGVFRDVPCTGIAQRGGTVIVSFLNGQPKFAIGRGGNGASSGGGGSTTIVYNGSSGGSSGGGGGGGPVTYADLPPLSISVGNLVIGGGLISDDGVASVAVDPSKLQIAGNLFKTGGGGLTIQALNNVAIDVATSGTVAMGAGTLSINTLNNYATAQHTHIVAALTYSGQSASLMATDPSGGMGVWRLGLGSAAQAGYSIYSGSQEQAYFAGPMRLGGAGVRGGGAMFYVEASNMTQFRIAYNGDAFMEYSVSSTGSATIYATGPDPSLAHIYFTASSILMGAGAPTAKLNVLDTNRAQLRLLQDADSAADFRVGTHGELTISTTTGTIGDNPSNSHIYFSPGGRVGFGVAGTPGAYVESQSTTLPQMRWSYGPTSNNASATWQVNGTGGLTVTTTGTDFVFDLQPVGGMAGTKYVYPAHSYDVNLGRLDRKFLGIFGAELLVETLVALDTEATIGGRILVTPSTPLAVDLAASDTSMQTKYNNLAVGDILRFEGRGYVEFMSVLGGPSGSGPYTYTVARNLDGTGANAWYAGDVCANLGKPGVGFIDIYSWWSSRGQPIEFIYTRSGATFSANLSSEQEWKLFGPATVPQVGDLTYYGMGGGMWSNFTHTLSNANGATFTGTLEYWNGSVWTSLVGATETFTNTTTGTTGTIGLGSLPTGTGLLQLTWTASSQTNWTLTTINGVSAYWVRWRITANTSGFATQSGRRVIRSSAQFGPAMVGYVRNSTVYNDYTARWALGSLQGHYDYSILANGFAAGNFSSTWVAADDVNGFRVMRGTARIGWWDTAGNLKLYGTSGTAKIAINADGSGYVSGGAIAWDINGNATVTGTVNVNSGSVSMGDNLIYNSTFNVTDFNNDGWTIYNNNPGTEPATQTHQSSGGVDGGHFARLTWAVANTGVKGWYVTGDIKRSWKPLTIYVISFYAKASGSNVGKTMEVRWNTNPATTTTLVNNPLTTSWQRYAWRITWGATPDNASHTAGTMFISIAFNSASTGDLDLDHVAAEEGSVLSLWKPSNDELLPGTVKAIHISTTTLGAIVADLGTIYAGDIRLGNQDALTYNASTFTGLRLYKSGSTYRLAGYSAGAIQAYFDSDGKIKAGGGAVLLDANGVAIEVGDAYDPHSSYKTTFSGLVIGDYYSTVGLGGVQTVLASNAQSGSDNQLGLYSGGNATDASIVYLAAGWRASSGSMVGQSATITLTSEVGVTHSIAHYAPSGHVFTGGAVRIRESSGRATPLSVGSVSEDYVPSSTKWSNNAVDYATITLNGLNSTSIAFHDSGARVDAILAAAGVITLGYDAGFGNARTQIDGAIGTAWATISPASNWSAIGSGNFDTALRYKKVGDLVFVTGTLKRVTSGYTANTAIITLPTGFRPTYRTIRAVWGDYGASPQFPGALRIDIETNGTVFAEVNIAVGGFLELDFWFTTL